MLALHLFIIYNPNLILALHGNFTGPITVNYIINPTYTIHIKYNKMEH